MALTKPNFYAYASTPDFTYSDSTVNGVLVDWLLTSFVEMLEDHLNFPFRLIPTLEADKVNCSTNNTRGSYIISIGAFQEAGLKVKRAYEHDKEAATLASSELVLGQDYTLEFYRGRRLPSGLNKPNPVLAIRLACTLYPHEILRVWGTRGFSDGFPAELDMFIFAMVKQAIDYSQASGKSVGAGGSGGGGQVLKIKDYTTEVQFANDAEANKYAQGVFENFLATPVAQGYLAKYTRLLSDTITIL